MAYGAETEDNMPLAEEFLRENEQDANAIDAQQALAALAVAAERGLAGMADGLPMVPAYISPDAVLRPSGSCALIDAGGTNLRTALAHFDDAGVCRIGRVTKRDMPGLRRELSHSELYAEIAAGLPASDRIGFCFSFNVDTERTLDGRLLSWCKEIKSPGAVGHYVGRSLAEALGPPARHIVVLNDTTAAYLGGMTQARRLGCGGIVALVYGTGFSLCYAERCQDIPKLPADLRFGRMIVCTEAGEFDGFPKGRFDLEVIASSEAPLMAHAEKQCSGGYLGQLIARAWQTALDQGLLYAEAGTPPSDLARISALLAGADEPAFSRETQPLAAGIAAGLVARAAKIVAILTAIFALRADDRSGRPIGVIAEGSTFWKLTGFESAFCRQLGALLAPHGLSFQLLQQDDICLYGAARAAFAEPL